MVNLSSLRAHELYIEGFFAGFGATLLGDRKWRRSAMITRQKTFVPYRKCRGTTSRLAA